MNKKCIINLIVLLTGCVCMALGSLVYASQAGKAYNDSNKKLSDAYQKALAIMTDPDDKRLFVEAQAAWIKFRDAQVAFHGRYFPGSKGGLFVATDLTEERAQYLEMLLTRQAMEAHQEQR